MADAPGENKSKKPPVDVEVKIEKAADGEQRPESTYLKIWYERRGEWDVVHVTNLGTTDASWTGRVYEDGPNCVCMAPKMCIVGPVVTKANGADTRAYAGLHSCYPIIVIPPPQGTRLSFTK